MKHFIMAIVLWISTSGMGQQSIQEELRETPTVKVYCQDILVKYQNKITKYEDMIASYKNQLSDNINIIGNKRKIVLASIKLNWYNSQLQIEKKYCELSPNEQLDIDLGE